MSVFHFKQFSVDDADCAMKVGTDSVLLGAWADVNGFCRYRISSINLPFSSTSPRFSSISPRNSDDNKNEVAQPLRALNVVDIGAGSGLLSLMVAQRAPEAQILAIESDPLASEASKVNFENSPWRDRLTAVCANVFDYTLPVAPDLIICNPPYFSNGILSPDMRRAAARHSGGILGPLSALEYAARTLAPNGSLAMVTPADFADDLTYLAEMHHVKVWRRCDVSTVASKPPTRILWQFSPDHSKKYEYSSLVVRSGSSFTDEYKSLTRDFYLAF